MMSIKPDTIQYVNQSNTSLVSEEESHSLWGIASCIDLYHCNPDTIRSAEKIKTFVDELVEHIGMKAFGETRIVHFGEDEKVAGFSMVQLIETSLISGHFANASNAVYLDIFSCKYYDQKCAARFAQEYFEAERVSLSVNRRKA